MTTPGLQLRHVEYFVVLAREGHFARAAAACGVAQPTLSGGIVALEEALGRRLVNRDRRFMGLTPEGHAALPWAQRLLADHDALRGAAIAAAGPLEGELVLGCIPAALAMVGPFARELTQTHPGVQIQVRSLTARQIDQALAAFEIDAAITYLEADAIQDRRAASIYDERYLFATRRDGPYGGSASIAWTAATGASLGLLTSDMQFRRSLDAHVERLGLTLRPTRTANSYLALLSLVLEGEVSTILPHAFGAMVRRDSDLSLMPLTPEAPSHAVGLVVAARHPRAPLAQAALDAASAPRLQAAVAARLADL